MFEEIAYLIFAFSFFWNPEEAEGSCRRSITLSLDEDGGKSTKFSSVSSLKLLSDWKINNVLVYISYINGFLF